jgi:hypothetical protein
MIFLEAMLADCNNLNTFVKSVDSDKLPLWSMFCFISDTILYCLSTIVLY